jgi:acyl transferase domain-containing protein
MRAADPAALEAQLDQLAGWVSEAASTDMHDLARRWYREAGSRAEVTPSSEGRSLAIVTRAGDPGELRRQLDRAREAIRGDRSLNERGVYYRPHPLRGKGHVAFVYPGSGSQFQGMGRALLTQWPAALRRQHAQNERLASQFASGQFWDESPRGDATPQQVIFAQVTLGTMITDLLGDFGLRPSAVIGYSLGESAGLFSLGAWRDRDEMLRRIQASSLFTEQLAGPCLAAREAWNLGLDESVEWVVAMVGVPGEVLREALRHRRRIYLLIVNTPTECVIGGNRSEVERLARELGCTLHPISGVTTVHCEVAQCVSDAYRRLHLFETTPPKDVRFYSAASAAAYEVTPEAAADSILQQALSPFDFPRVVEQAYADGARIFVEVGPGATCTRMIDRILGDRPHWAASACPNSRDETRDLIQLLAGLHAEGVPCDLSMLYESRPVPAIELASDKGAVTVTRGAAHFSVPPLPGESVEPPMEPPQPRKPAVATSNGPPVMPSSAPTSNTPFQPTATAPLKAQRTADSSTSRRDTLVAKQGMPASADRTAGELSWLIAQAAQTQTARAEAQQAYLEQSQRGFEALGRALTWRATLLQQAAARSIEGLAAENLAFENVAVASAVADHVTIDVSPPPVQPFETTHAGTSHTEISHAGNSLFRTEPLEPTRAEPPHTGTASADTSRLAAPRADVLLTREMCLEFAVGSIAQVLGERFREADHFPTRVRLPDEPLMLVDRVMAIEGEPCSMTRGRIVTEHDVLPDAWYLDAGRIPTCIAVEAGQADLMLSGYLGIDLQTHGRAVYRLLDAEVIFHRSLPAPGDTIHYDIQIERFFRQGQMYLFRFHFDATVNGQPLMTMRNGCAGFFTAEELAAGQGVVLTGMDRRSMPGKQSGGWRPLLDVSRESYSDLQLDALRDGDLAGCFGPQFAELPLTRPTTLPRGHMKLVDRIVQLDPQGGRFGLGQIVGQADIHPDAWFLTCHFVDDRVMPGTLMYECCLHTLRVLLMRMGWVGETSDVVWEPIPGVKSQLQCRGQVTEETSQVRYEVSIKEIGYAESGGAPYVLADALMYADDKLAVQMKNMSLRLQGQSREGLESLWRRTPSREANGKPVQSADTADTADTSDVTSQPREAFARPTDTTATAEKAHASHVADAHRGIAQQETGRADTPLFDRRRILAIAEGKPSEAFGEPYRVFDQDRVIARLPRPPFLFLDRVTSIEECRAWELKPGGRIEAQYDVPPDAWYFSSQRQPQMPFCVLMEVALQPCGWFAAYLGSALRSEHDLAFRNLGGSGRQWRDVTPESGTLTTRVSITSISQSGDMIIQHFEFEVRDHLGMVYAGKTYFGFFTRESLAHQVGLTDAVPYVPPAEELALAEQFDYPTEFPFPDDSLRMVHRIDVLLSEGGPHRLGFIEGSIEVDPAAWFFEAHFYQDPVWPGSLGVESFVQLLKVLAWRRWGGGALPASSLGAEHVASGAASDTTAGNRIRWTVAAAGGDSAETTSGETPHQTPPGSRGSTAKQPGPGDGTHDWTYRGQIIPGDHRVTVQAVVVERDEKARRLTAEGYLCVDGRIIYRIKRFTLTMCDEP